MVLSILSLLYVSVFRSASGSMKHNSRQARALCDQTVLRQAQRVETHVKRPVFPKTTQKETNISYASDPRYSLPLATKHREMNMAVSFVDVLGLLAHGNELQRPR